MARNAEKAMTTLARWRAAQLEDNKLNSAERRPFLASSCYDAKKAEKWRRQIISEISRKVAQIQNAGIGVYRIRDLNDEINKLLREKGHWETRIKELGGPDYMKIGPKIFDIEGKEVPGNKGYKYFGAAKDLPGVRELFESDSLPPPRKTRAELMKHIDPDYYGYLDEDDGIVLPLEAEAELRARDKATADWKASRALEGISEDRCDLPTKNSTQAKPSEISRCDLVLAEENFKGVRRTKLKKWPFVASCAAHVIPSQKDIEVAIIEHKKRILLADYVTDNLDDAESDAKEGAIVSKCT